MVSTIPFPTCNCFRQPTASKPEPGASLSQSQTAKHGHKFETIHGVDVVWQRPRRCKGVLFVAHGCNGDATDFFPRSHLCPNCSGSPEEVNITRTALAMNYTVIAINSQDRTHKCWQTGQSRHEDSSDLKKVRQVLRAFVSREGLKHKPIYALGVSSGGVMALMMARKVPLAGICSQLTGLPPGVLGSLVSNLPEGRVFPPTMFVHMPRDRAYARMIDVNRAILSSESLPVRVIEVRPRPLTPELLCTKLPSITPTTAAAMIRALSQADVLDAEGYVIADPSENDEWREAIKSNKVVTLEDVSLLEDGSPLSEVMNLACGKHAAVSEVTADMLTWFESRPYTTAAAAKEK
eukprot:jgi/Chrzof1/9637/Cz04g10160.t1